MREHGGNLDLALQRFGGRAEDWIDLSTGINRQPYPVGEVASRHWSALPSRSDIEVSASGRAARLCHQGADPGDGWRAGGNPVAAGSCLI